MKYRPTLSYVFPGEESLLKVSGNNIRMTIRLTVPFEKGLDFGKNNLI